MILYVPYLGAERAEAAQDEAARARWRREVPACALTRARARSGSVPGLGSDALGFKAAAHVRQPHSVHSEVYEAAVQPHAREQPPPLVLVAQDFVSVLGAQVLKYVRGGPEQQVWRHLGLRWEIPAGPRVAADPARRCRGPRLDTTLHHDTHDQHNGTDEYANHCPDLFMRHGLQFHVLLWEYARLAFVLTCPPPRPRRQLACHHKVTILRKFKMPLFATLVVEQRNRWLLLLDDEAFLPSRFSLAGDLRWDKHRDRLGDRGRQCRSRIARRDDLVIRDAELRQRVWVAPQVARKPNRKAREQCLHRACNRRQRAEEDLFLVEVICDATGAMLHAALAEGTLFEAVSVAAFAHAHLGCIAHREVVVLCRRVARRLRLVRAFKLGAEHTGDVAVQRHVV